MIPKTGMTKKEKERKLMRAKKPYIAVARKLVRAKKAFLRCAKISTNKVVHSALHNLLLDEVISGLPQEGRWKIESAYDVYYNGERNIPDETKESVAKIETLLVQKRAQLAKANRTGRLWVQLLDYIDTICCSSELNDWEIGKCI